MHTVPFRLRPGGNPFTKSALLTGSIGLALLPLLANAQINRSRPPTPPPSSGSSNSGSSNSGRSGSSGSSNSQGQSSERNRTPPERSSGGGGNSSGGSVRNNPATGGRNGNNNNSGNSSGSSGSSNSGSGGGLRFNPASQRGSGQGAFSNEVHSYTSPLSPFATYKPPNGGANNRTPNRQGPYTGPLSPFMTYQPPSPTRNFPSSGYDRFNRRRESFQFRYRNGVFGRNFQGHYPGWGEVFFPGGLAYFPYYYPRPILGTTCPSPYIYYSGFFPGYISVSVGYYSPPPYVYVPVPLYQNGYYSGWRRDDLDDYYLNREADRLREQERRQQQREEDLNARERELRAREERANRADRDLTIAVDNITRAWTDRDIQMLAKHTRRDAKIAVYLRGKYQYSLDATDYLDMTRDALNAGKTVKFKLDKIERKQKDIYLVTGRHTYKNQDGEERNVVVSYVLEKMDGEYVITQVGTAPERLEDSNE